MQLGIIGNLGLIDGVVCSKYDGESVLVYGKGWLTLYTIQNGILKPEDIELDKYKPEFTAIAFEKVNDLE